MKHATAFADAPPRPSAARTGQTVGIHSIAFPPEVTVMTASVLTSIIDARGSSMLFRSWTALSDVSSSVSAPRTILRITRLVSERLPEAIAEDVPEAQTRRQKHHHRRHRSAHICPAVPRYSRTDLRHRT